MIDRAALEQVAPKQIEGMASPSGVSLVLHLFNGETYTVSRIIEYYDDYIVVAVYPAQALSPDTLKDVIPSDDKGRLILDRLVLPYRAISYLAITAREPQKQFTLGFRG
ncbi:MAG: hypothetical protein RMM58_15935 [Chloroflexota bacterium]|nr:hypothetical protein [Chloroflexota bacterium]